MRMLFSFGLAVCLLFICAASSHAEADRPLNWAKAINYPPVENFYEVAPGLYRSEQPSAEAMQAIEKMGIKTVINLRAYHTDDKEAQGTNLILRHLPLNTWNIKESVVVSALRMLKTEEKPILVHCQHGADRTGLLMALYRILDQGWTREEALEELQNGGFGHHSIWMNIPRYIRNVDIEKLRKTVGEDLYPSPGTAVQTSRE